MEADRRCERDVVHRTNEKHKACRTLKCGISNRRLGLNAKKYLYVGGIAQRSCVTCVGLRSVVLKVLREENRLWEMKCS